MLGSENGALGLGDFPWQVDFYRCPLKDESGEVLWCLVACSPDRQFEKVAFCPQDRANGAWVAGQLRGWIDDSVRKGAAPTQLRAFRPQAIALLTGAAQKLGIPLHPTRNTAALKQRLLAQAQLFPELDGYTGEHYDPLDLDPPPPQPMPEELQGDRWQFAALSLEDLRVLADRPMPEGDMNLLRLSDRLPGDLAVPGTIFYGGEKSLALVSWIAQVNPVWLKFQSGDPHGLLLEAGLSDRWVMATFSDREVFEAGVKFERRLQGSGGLHFLVVMPDESGATVTGLWVLVRE